MDDDDSDSEEDSEEERDEGVDGDQRMSVDRQDEERNREEERDRNERHAGEGFRSILDFLLTRIILFVHSWYLIFYAKSSKGDAW